MNKYQSKDTWKIDKRAVIDDLKKEISIRILEMAKERANLKPFYDSKLYKDKAIPQWASKLTEKDILKYINKKQFEGLFNPTITESERLRKRKQLSLIAAESLLKQNYSQAEEINNAIKADEILGKIDNLKTIIKKNEKIIKDIEDKSFNTSLNGRTLEGLEAEYRAKINKAEKEIKELELEIAKTSKYYGDKYYSKVEKQIEKLENDITGYNAETLGEVKDKLRAEIGKLVLNKRNIEAILKSTADKQEAEKLKEEADKLDKKIKYLDAQLKTVAEKIKSIRNKDYTELEKLKSLYGELLDIKETLEKAESNSNRALHKLDYYVIKDKEKDELSKNISDRAAKTNRELDAAAANIKNTDDINLDKLKDKIQNSKTVKEFDSNIKKLNDINAIADKVKALQDIYKEIIDFYKEKTKIEIDKQGSLRQFVEELTEEIKRNTPKTSDEEHKRNHKADGIVDHLRDSINYAKINDDTYVVYANSPYANFINESYNLKHINGGRAGNISDVALEYSAMSGDPYTMYLGIGEPTVGIYKYGALALLITNSLEENKNRTVRLSNGGNYQFNMPLVKSGITEYSEIETEYINKIFRELKGFLPDDRKKELEKLVRQYIHNTGIPITENELSKEKERIAKIAMTNKKRWPEVVKLKNKIAELKLKIDPYYRILAKIKRVNGVNDLTQEEIDIVQKISLKASGLVNEILGLNTIAEVELRELFNPHKNPLQIIKKQEQKIEEIIIDNKDETSEILDKPKEVEIKQNLKIENRSTDYDTEMYEEKIDGFTVISERKQTEKLQKKVKLIDISDADISRISNKTANQAQLFYNMSRHKTSISTDETNRFTRFKDETEKAIKHILNDADENMINKLNKYGINIIENRIAAIATTDKLINDDNITYDKIMKQILIILE